MIVIIDNRKDKYLVDIKRRLVSNTYETMCSSKIINAYKFKEKDKKKLFHFENLLNYKHGELEYVEV